MTTLMRLLTVQITRNYKKIGIFCAVIVFLYIIRSITQPPGEIPVWDDIRIDDDVPIKREDSNGNVFIDTAQDIDENDDFMKRLQSVPAALYKKTTCPACFGTDVCSALEKDILKIDIPDPPTELSKQGIYFGAYKRKRVMIRSYVDRPEWTKFDQFVCKNATGTDKCNVSLVVKKSFISNYQKSLVPAHLKHAYHITETAPETHSNMACVTDILVDQFKDLVGSGPFDKITPEDTAMLYTSIVAIPEAINYRFLGDIDIPHVWAFPPFLGACGRMLVIEYEGRPLANYINHPWDKRADLAMQLLQFIDALMDGDPSWYLIYSGFHMDNFIVQADGRLVATNAEDVIIIERESANEYEAPMDIEEICNDHCINKFAKELYNIASPTQEKSCSKAFALSGNAMYALACRNILSDLPPHRNRAHEGWQTSIKSNSKHKGLLHSIPSRHVKSITELLEECVTETAPGGRLVATEELMEILSQYTEQGI